MVKQSVSGKNIVSKKTGKRKIAILGCISFLALSVILWGIFSGYGVLLKMDEFKIDKKEVSFDLPNWISEEGSREINNLLLLHNEKSVFDKDLTEDIAKVYNRNPVFKRVVSVKRKFPNKIKVSLELRKPIALVKSKGNVFLVDSDSIRLPGRYYKWPDSNEYTMSILVDKLKDVPISGKKWNDQRVLAGVDIVKFLKKNKADKLLRIENVDVSGVGSRFLTRKSDIILWTKNGTKIKWGCSPLCGEADELSDADKLRNLFSVARVTGNKFDGLEYVDVRWTRPVGKK